MKNRTLRRQFVAGSFAAVLLMGVFTTGSAQASTIESDGDETSPLSHFQEVVGDSLVFEPIDSVPANLTPTSEGGVQLRAAGFVVTCTPKAENPHISEGARKQGKIYVIYKTKVTCTGTGNYPSTVKIRVKGGLMWDKAKSAGDTSDGIKWEMIKSSDETRTVKVNGKSNTFYTPLDGVTGGQKTGHYQGSTTVTIVTPTGQKVGSSISKPVFCKPTSSTATCKA